MATVNLGRIKPVFKGAYNNSTAYVVDDIVTSGGSSYICIQASTGNAVSNATYWTQMSSAGTNGTDVGTTITTQGDILYRDGSGLARLGAGTSGQVLQTGGAGANPSWGTVSSDFVHIKTIDASNVSSVEMVHGANNVVFDGTYEQYILKILNYYEPTSGAELRLRITTDSGSTYKSSGYVGHRFRFYYSAPSTTDSETNTTALWQWWYQQGGDNASQSRSFGEVYLSKPTLGSYPHAFGQYSGAENNQIIIGAMSGKYQTGGAYNGLQLTKNNGANFYAKISLYGIKG